MAAAGPTIPRSATREPGWYRVPLLGLIWVLTYFGVRMVLERGGLETPARMAIALIPLVPFLAFLRAWVNGIREMDELDRRIQLEALAIAFPLTMVLLMVLGLMQLATPLSMDDWSYRHAWAYLPLFYFGGVALATRRYR